METFSVVKTHDDIQSLRKYIHIKGARSNNLKDIEVLIPKNKLIIVTGVSGSGKSSLIIDTLYAEGQRRYVESLSSYARQFLDRMKKPEVDYIKGICPAIAIEQKVSSGNARSTVGSMTELYDYIRLLFARIGKTISPVSGHEVKKHHISDVVDHIFSYDIGSKIQLFAPIKVSSERTIRQELEMLIQKGYTRIELDGRLTQIEDILHGDIWDLNISFMTMQGHMRLLVDRFVVNEDEDNKKRVADSVLSAFSESDGDCIVSVIGGDEIVFNNRFELDNIRFIEPSPMLFNFNNPLGACPKCEGYGKMMGIDPDKVIPDEKLSVYQEAIVCWRGEKGKTWWQQLIMNASLIDFPIHKPYKNLTPEQKELLWKGNDYFRGIDDFFEELESQMFKIQNRVILSRYRGKTTCHLCQGSRLRKEATYVKVGGKSIHELTHLALEDIYVFFNELTLNEQDASVAKRLLYEIVSRLKTMVDMGLGYLTLDRQASTLSGGETQRIHLTRTLGSNLTQSLYILDEPSVGLHPRDTDNLVKILKQLRDLGNTVVVIEHEESVIRAADHIIEIGPMAGIHGGQLVYSGDYNNYISKDSGLLTADYLSGKKSIVLDSKKRKHLQHIYLKGARHHNLKSIDIRIPLHAMTVVSGVSGSGKTSLVKHILYPALKHLTGESLSHPPGKHDSITGDVRMIKSVEMISQSPLGRSSRSNPVTYVKAYDEIRKLFSEQQTSRINGFEPKHFSFNVEGGRCENCKGEGTLVVEMQFLADVTLICDECHGQRFKKEVLDVTYNDKNIYQILDMTIEESINFFKDRKKIVSRLKPLYDVGLGYIKLGQSSSTLSGGEAQRVKLASFLNKEFDSKSIFFIFDEPTTGLHFDDISKLMKAFQSLIERGHTVVIVEHNTDVISSADWVIDLGPEAGDKGGYLVFEGLPKDLKHVKESLTGPYLKI